MGTHLDVGTIVLIAAGSASAWASYRSPRLGAAILVGVGVIALLCAYVQR